MTDGDDLIGSLEASRSALAPVGQTAGGAPVYDFSGGSTAAPPAPTALASSSPQSAPVPQLRYSSPTDALIRATYGEAGGEGADGQQAVAAVLLNRARAAKEGVDKAILAPGVLESVSSPEAVARMNALDPNSATYKAIAANVQAAMGGADPTGGATQFYNPTLQAQLGRPKPSWDNGSGQRIGNQVFFGGSPPGDDLGSILEANRPAPASSTPAPAPADDGTGIATPTGLIYSDGSPITSQRMANAWKSFTQSKAYNAKAAPGTPGNPYGQAHGIAPVAGATYIGDDGKLYTPTQADVDAYNAAAKSEGMGDAGGAMLNGLAQGYAPEIVGGIRYVESGFDPRAYAQGANVADAQLQAYRAAHSLPANLLTGAGSLASGAEALDGAGNMLMASGAPALLGPTGTFLSGAAGLDEAGNAVGMGNRLLSVASKGANAGVQGAAFGAGSSHLDPDEPVWKQALLGGVTGGVLGTAIPAVSAAGGLAHRGLEPFTAGGRDAIVDRLLGEAAQGQIAPSDLNLTQYVPGSSPTLAQATGNPGIGALERAVRSTPQGATAFGARDASNTAARNALIDGLTGDDVSLDALKAARSTNTTAARQAAFANASPTDATGVVSTIDGILNSPAGQRDAVSKVLGDIRSKLVQQVPGTNLAQVESDPAQLYGIRQALTDHLATQGPKTASDARLATSELMQVKGALDDAIEAGAPGYKSYLQQFSDASGPIDEQQLLQSMRLHDMRGNVTLGKVDQAINRLTQAQSANGANAAKSVSPETMDALSGVRDDLRREAAGSGVGKFVGSNTVQNLASNALMDNMGVPAALGLATPHGAVAGAALGLGKMALASKNGPLQDLLINRLLDPSGFAGIGQGGAGAGAKAWVNNLLTHGLVPAAIGSGRNYLLPAPAR